MLFGIHLSACLPVLGLVLWCVPSLFGMQVGRDHTTCTSIASGEDDMTEGDLGDGTRVRPKVLSYKMKHPVRSRSQGDFQELLSPTHSLKRNSFGAGGKETFSWTSCSEMCSGLRQDLLHGGQLSHSCGERESGKS